MSPLSLFWVGLGDIYLHLRGFGSSLWSRAGLALEQEELETRGTWGSNRLKSKTLNLVMEI